MSKFPWYLVWIAVHVEVHALGLFTVSFSWRRCQGRSWPVKEPSTSCPLWSAGKTVKVDSLVQENAKVMKILNKIILQQKFVSTMV
jgi:hypothetical protein